MSDNQTSCIDILADFFDAILFDIEMLYLQFAPNGLKNRKNATPCDDKIDNKIF